MKITSFSFEHVYSKSGNLSNLAISRIAKTIIFIDKDKTKFTFYFHFVKVAQYSRENNELNIFFSKQINMAVIS